MFKNFYLPISASREGQAAADIVEILFQDIHDNIHKVPDWIRNLSDSDEKAAADFLSGMTDNFAITQAEQLRPWHKRRRLPGKGLNWISGSLLVLAMPLTAAHPVVYTGRIAGRVGSRSESACIDFHDATGRS